MAGKIIADTIEHSSAGSVDTTYVVDGVTKTWAACNGQASPSATITASLNVSSIADNGTGIYSFTLTNAFSGTIYENCGIGGIAGGNTGVFLRISTGATTSSVLGVRVETHTGSTQDRENNFVISGDLA
jgi:hypothetical protein